MSGRRFMLTVIMITAGVCFVMFAGVMRLNEVKTMAGQKKNAGSEMVEYYLRGLTSEHADKRNRSLAWLIENPAQSHSALVEIVKAARHDQCTLGAIYLLGQIGCDSDVPLLEALLTRETSKLTWESAQALGRHKSPEAFAALARALESDNPESIGAAVVALGIRGDESARRLLERQLGHADESIRYRAVYALRELGVRPSSDALKKHRQIETSADVCRLINEALGNAGGG